MKTIFLRTLKDRRTLLSIYCVTIILFIWMYVSIYPTVRDQSANFEQFLKSYPEGLMEAFDIDMATYTTFSGFLAVEQFSFVWPLILIFMLVGFCGGAVAGEIEKGTIEFLLSQPIPRWKIILGKFLAGLLMLLIFVVISSFSVIPFLKIYKIDYGFASFFNIAILGFIFGLAIFSLGMFFSVIFSDRGKVFFATGGILVLMYVLNLVAKLKESLSNLQYFSFFHYYDPNQALIYYKIDHWAYWVFLICFAVFSILALIIFSKRDVAV